MKNPFLSNFKMSDLAFQWMKLIPKSVRRRIVAAYVNLAERRMAKRQFPDRLTIFLTDQCNLRCEHCFIAKGQPKGWEMGVSEYEMLFRSLRGRVAQILLTGGEPTIRSEFSDILMLTDRVARAGTVSVFSNGVLWQRLQSALERLMRDGKAKANVQTSIDGFEGLHDCLRGKQGAFKSAVELIRMVNAIRRRYPNRIGRLLVTTSISRKNLSELREIVRFASRCGATPVFTFVRRSTDGVHNVADASLVSRFEPEQYGHYLDPKEMRQAIRLIDDELWSKNPGCLPYAFNRVTLESIVTGIETETEPAACRMGQVDVVILPDGSVARCEMLKPAINLKNFGWDFEKFFSSKDYADYLRRSGRCWCTHDCAVGVSALYEPKMLNALFEPS